MAGYKIKAIESLKDQLLYAPERVRKEQAGRLEHLILELQPEALYPYDYVCFRITKYRPEANASLVFPGKLLKPDLMRFLLDLSYTVRVAASEVGERVLGLRTVMAAHRISPRTLFRWRLCGLLARWYVFEDGRRRLGVRQSWLDAFVAAHASWVKRSSRFSRMDETEKDAVLRRAAACARDLGLNLSQTALRISQETGRSREAIRYTLRRYDATHPTQPLFPNTPTRLTSSDRASIATAFEQGLGATELARKFGKARSVIYRVVNQKRAAALLADQPPFVHHPSFDAPDAEKSFAPCAALKPNGTNMLECSLSAVRRTRSSSSQQANPPLADCTPAGKSVPLASKSVDGDSTVLSAQADPRHPTRFNDAPSAPLLSREQEQALFRRYNYLKYRIAKLKDGLRLVTPRASLIAEIEALRKSACEVKNQIVQSNLRLVVSVAKRHVGRSATLADLVSDGNFCLLRAVETFDFTRGNRFSTYATWALIKHYARTVPEENYVLDRFVTGREEVLEQAGVPAEDVLERSDLLRVLGDAVGRILTRLSKRERSIIVARYGIGGESEPQTLEQVGRAFGLTRERIRQIEAGALRKLRDFLRAEPALEASL